MADGMTNSRSDGSVAPDVAPLVSMFEESEEATRSSREKAERDIDYRDNKQWTAEEEAALKARKQPVVTFNRIQRKVDYLSGLEKQSRKDPKAFPRTPGDSNSADAATDAIRYVCDDNSWDDVRSLAWDDIMTPGTGAVMVGARNVRGGVDPMLTHIPWDRFFHDPHSSRFDFSDASYMGIVTWMDVDEAKARWGDAAETIVDTWQQSRWSDTYDDKPKHHLWSDYRRKRVRVIEIYYLRGGTWMRCVFTKSGHLEAPEPSPYLDEDGQPENPIKAVSAYVDRDNNRFGCVRVMISPQDEVNKRRSKALHLITMRQARVSPSGGVSEEQVRRELAKPDGVLMGDQGDVEILPTNDMAAANLQMLQEAKAEIDLLGANSALSGKNENDMSGRAILAQQQGGMVEVARLFDRLRCLSLSVYRAIWARIRQYWKAERWVRITDNDLVPRFVGLNQPVSIAQLIQGAMQGDQMAMQDAARQVPRLGQMLQAAAQGDQQAQMMAAQLMQDPRSHQPILTRNEVAAIDIDIIIDEGMDTPTIQAEQFDTLVKMAPNAPPTMAPILWQLIIQASQLRDKDKLLELMNQPPSPEQQQEEQLQKQLVVESATAEIDKTKSETAKNIATAEKTRVDAQLGAFQTGADMGMAA